MPDNESIPYFDPMEPVTGHCTAAVRGKRFVAISGSPVGGMIGTENPRIAEAGAGVKAFGVSAYDGAINEEIPTLSGVITPVVAGAALVAGQEVQSDGQGRAIPLAAGRPSGQAVEDQATVDADVAIKVYS